MKMISVSDFNDRFVLHMTALPMGKDFCVVLFGGGGEPPHIGAVAVAQPRPSLKKDGSVSSTASVIAILGRQEDMLARKVALHMAKELNAAVSVSCGVHLEDATPEELDQIVELSESLMHMLIAKARELQASPGSGA